MKKMKIFILGLAACAFGLSSCYADLGFVKFGKLEETNKVSNNQSGNNNNNNGENQNNNSQTESLIDTLKSMIKPIAAKMLNKSESSVSFGDYNDETSEADVYYYESSSLTFVVAADYKESYDTGMADKLKAYLPSGASLSKNNDFEDYADYGMMFYDRYYSLGEYTYNIYVEAYEADDEYPAETSSYVFLYKTSQQSAYESFMTAE